MTTTPAIRKARRTKHEGERWRAVVGHEGKYEVSDHGRVRSLSRIVMHRHQSGKLVPHPLQGRMLSAGTMKSGHKVVALGRETNTVLVHVLVLEAFVGPCPKAFWACHWDDDGGNNHLGNLRWDTPSANKRDGYRNGRFKVGQDKPLAKLRDKDIPKIRALFGKLTYTKIGIKFGVSAATISQIEKGRTWRHVH